jgi:chromosome segregation ATPase
MISGARTPSLAGDSPITTPSQRRGSLQPNEAVLTPRSLRRGSLQVEELPSFSRNRNARGEADDTRASEAAMASSLQEAQKGIEERIGEALDEIDNLQDVTAEKLPDGVEDQLLELELGLHNAFDSMVRDIEKVVKGMSERDSEVHREHSKAAAKQFAAKLENARTASNVSLKNKSIELSASFDKQMRQQLAELKEGGGSLLLEAREAAEKAQQELAEERMKHDSCKETLRITSEKLQELEQQTGDWKEDQIFLESEKRRLEKEVADGRHGLADAIKELKAQISQMLKDNSSILAENSVLSESLEVAVTESESFKNESVTLAEQVQQLVDIQEALKHQLDVSSARIEEERNRTQEALRVSAAEAERAAIAQEQDMRRLTGQLSDRMQQTVAAMDSGGELDAHAQQMQHLFAELKDIQMAKSELDASQAELKKENKKVTVELQDAKKRWAEGKSQSETLGKMLEQRETQLKEVKAQAEAQEEELQLLRKSSSRPRPTGDTKGVAKQLEALKVEVDTVRGELKRLQGEKKGAHEAMEKALEDLGFTKQMNMSLSQQIQNLVNSVEDARKAEKAAEGRLNEVQIDFKFLQAKSTKKQEQLEAELVDANAKIAEGKKWHGETLKLRAEIERIEAALRDAVSSAELIKNDKRQLSEQIREIDTRYRTADQALQHTSRELVTVTAALQHSTSELSRRTDAARRERETLVRAALASMQQLRSHLTFTLAGLRIHQSKGEHATMPWKRSAGIITPGGDPMLVQFVPPLHKSIAEQGGSARQPDYLYAQEDSATLPPVQIQPPVQLPPSETWHSDTPPDPMLPSNKLGRSVDMHRWGANVRPPLIANPGRAPSARRSPRVASARATKQAAKWQQGEIARPRTALSLGLKSVADTEPLLHRWGGDSSEHGAGSSRGDSLANLQACAASST